MLAAQKLLESYGWKAGKGLGKNENGIAKFTVGAFKTDSSGLGTEVDEFSNCWWNSMYDKSAKNISGGKKVIEPIPKVETPLVYGKFVKSIPVVVDKSDQQAEYDLFQACKGRRASHFDHAGKLKRLQQQESDPTGDILATLKKPRKGLFKKKRPEKKRKRKENKE
eukprot:TRINITY_DN10303_c0_g1_i1.p1 TRINITY_DN10303_c0_g1~~TRINITY_DN10303_c0_g1_i1.p1  ORF type:complete len:166 (+),score=27.28 TRINITY_DN10303_c0_g1_i1:39-536(+)